ncbi:MAG: hypothetical protein RLZZ175_2934 [Bacteroidota bacterium]|jgi:p-aminobenzoyl-glutamate transporter AbgT
MKILIKNKINILIKTFIFSIIISCNNNHEKLHLDCKIEEDLCISNLETLNLPNNFDNSEYRKLNFNIKNEIIKITSFSQNKQEINFEIYSHVVTFSEFIPLGKVIGDTLYVSVLENPNKKNEKYDMSVLKLVFKYNLGETDIFCCGKI